MTKRPDITVFLPSGCLSLESIQKYQDGGYSKKERAEISQHLKECRFCSEAMEGLLLIPDPFEQRAVVKSMRQGMFKSIRNRGDGHARRLWSGKKSNIAAIVAGIVLLTGVFSVYSYLLKRDSEFLAEENIRREKTEHMKDFIPKKGAEEEINKTTDIIIAKEKPVAIDKQATGQKSKKSTIIVKELTEVDASPFESAEEEEIISLQEEVPVQIQNTKEKPYANMGVSPLAKSSKIEMPKFKTEVPSQTNEKNNYSTVQTDDGIRHQDSLKSPEFKFKEYIGFNDYILKNLNKSHPDLIIPENKKIEMVFLVTSKGKIQNVHLIKGIDPEIDKKVIRLIVNSPAWIPATQNGKNIEYKIFLTIDLQEVQPGK